MPKESMRLEKIPPYLFEEIDRKKREAINKGVDIINLGIGDPDQPTPAYIVQSMQKAVENSQNHDYPSSNGEIDFRKAVVDWYHSRFSVSLDADKEVTCLIGSKEGLSHLSLAYIDKDDIAIVPSPSYPVYKMWTLMAGGDPYFVPLTRENDFLPDLNKIPEKVINKAKIIYLNYPNNPTGAIAPSSFLEKTVNFAKENDLLIVYDNAYCDMTYDHYVAPSILEIDGAKEVSIEFASLSKSYNMTGWRIAMAAGNEKAIKALRVIKSNVDSGQFKAIQQAAVSALNSDGSDIKRHNEIYTRRRDILFAGLKSLNWPLKDPPKATFYFWIPVPGGYDSASFASKLLESCGLVTVPGNGYGDAGEGYIRMAITVSEDRIQEAIDRMKNAGIRY